MLLQMAERDNESARNYCVLQDISLTGMRWPFNGRKLGGSGSREGRLSWQRGVRLSDWQAAMMQGGLSGGFGVR
jgi:hypothetical protein